MESRTRSDKTYTQVQTLGPPFKKNVLMPHKCKLLSTGVSILLSGIITLHIFCSLKHVKLVFFVPLVPTFIPPLLSNVLWGDFLAPLGFPSMKGDVVTQEKYGLYIKITIGLSDNRWQNINLIQRHLSSFLQLYKLSKSVKHIHILSHISIFVKTSRSKPAVK